MKEKKLFTATKDIVVEGRKEKQTITVSIVEDEKPSNMKTILETMKNILKENREEPQTVDNLSEKLKEKIIQVTEQFKNDKRFDYIYDYFDDEYEKFEEFYEQFEDMIKNVVFSAHYKPDSETKTKIKQQIWSVLNSIKSGEIKIEKQGMKSEIEKALHDVLEKFASPILSPQSQNLKPVEEDMNNAGTPISDQFKSAKMNHDVGAVQDMISSGQVGLVSPEVIEALREGNPDILEAILKGIVSRRNKKSIPQHQINQEQPPNSGPTMESCGNLEEGSQVSRDIEMKQAIKQGKTELAKSLHRSGVGRKKDTISLSAERGNEELLSFLSQFDKTTFDLLASHLIYPTSRSKKIQ